MRSSTSSKTYWAYLRVPNSPENKLGHSRKLASKSSATGKADIKNTTYLSQQVFKIAAPGVFSCSLRIFKSYFSVSKKPEIILTSLEVSNLSVVRHKIQPQNERKGPTPVF